MSTNDYHLWTLHKVLSECSWISLFLTPYVKVYVKRKKSETLFQRANSCNEIKNFLVHSSNLPV